MTTVLNSDNLRCPLTGKAAFITQAKAEEIIARAWQRENKTGQEYGRMPRRAYLCECGWWHMSGHHQREASEAA